MIALFLHKAQQERAPLGPEGSGGISSFPPLRPLWTPLTPFKTTRGHLWTPGCVRRIHSFLLWTQSSHPPTAYGCHLPYQGGIQRIFASITSFALVISFVVSGAYCAPTLSAYKTTRLLLKAAGFVFIRLSFSSVPSSSATQGTPRTARSARPWSWASPDRS